MQTILFYICIERFVKSYQYFFVRFFFILFYLQFYIIQLYCHKKTNFYLHYIYYASMESFCRWKMFSFFCFSSHENGIQIDVENTNNMKFIRNNYQS